MKRFTLLIFALILAGAFPVLAQQDNPELITLNDATPAIDVVIALPQDTTGTISLNFAQASITLADSSGAVMFSAADPRLHALEMNIAPNSGSHTLTVERLPGFSEAYVTAMSLPEMTINGTVEWVEGNAVTFNQEAALTLDVGTSGGTVSVSIPTETMGVVTATFPGADATTQLIDAAGSVLAQSNGGHVDGITFVLDAGNYDFTVLGNNLINTHTVVAGIRMVSTEEAGFTVLDPGALMTMTTANIGAECTATIAASSANLRSGPGTGYSVLGYGYRGETFAVGGHNRENNWIVIATDAGSAWVAASAAQMEGACNTLTVFDIPLRDSVPAQIILTTSESGGSANNSGQHESQEHEDDDHGSEHDD